MWQLSPVSPTPRQETEKPRYVSIPYYPGVSEKIDSLLRPLGLAVAHSAGYTLRDQLCGRLKDKTPRDQQKEVVYRIKCECEEEYIGETGRPVATRVKEHRTALSKAQLEKSAVAEHAANSQHEIQWDEVEIIGRERHYRKRKLLESHLIKQNRPHLNRDRGLEWASVWNCVKLDWGKSSLMIFFFFSRYHFH